MSNSDLCSFSFSPEMEVLTTVCRARFLKLPLADSGRGFVISPGSGFIRAARFHRVLPYIYPYLKESAWDLVPPEMQAKMTLIFNRQTTKAMKVSSELASIVSLFNQESVAVICLKGPLMTTELYGTIFDRHQGDIDLLGHVQDLDRVCSLLSQLGYQVQSETDLQMLATPRRLKAYMKGSQHVAFFNAEKQVLVEFHYRLFRNPHLLPIPAQHLWENLREVEYGGVPIKTLSLIDSALYVIVHGANHEWYYLKWLIDVAHLSQLPPVDWQQFNERAVKYGVQRMVVQAFGLAHQLLGSPVPQPCLPVQQPVIRQLTQRALQKINNCSRGPDLERKLYLTKLRRGFRYKCYILRMQLHLDFHSPHSHFRLPDSLFFLNSLLNPLLWLWGKYKGKRNIWKSRSKG